MYSLLGNRTEIRKNFHASRILLKYFSKADFPAYLILTISICQCYFYTIAQSIDDTVEWTEHFTNGDLYSPLIIPTVPDLTLEVGSNFTLTCKSMLKAIWSTEKFDELNTESKSDGIYTSYLLITNASVHQVGSYYCKALEKDTLLSNIYIYVNDPLNPLVPSDNTEINVEQFTEVVIPCKPASKSIDVGLKRKDGLEITPPPSYDPTIGFTMTMFDLSLNGSVLICSAKRPGKADYNTEYKVQLRPYKNFINKPVIVTNTSSHYWVFGDTVLINCSVEIPKSINYRIEFKVWAVIVNEEDLGINTTNPTMAIAQHNFSKHLLIVTSQLIITVSYRWLPSKILECRVVDNDNSMYQNSRKNYIRVNKERELEISGVSDDYLMKLGENVKISCVCDGYPPGTIRWFYSLCNINFWQCSSITDFPKNNFSSSFAGTVQISKLSFQLKEPTLVECYCFNSKRNISKKTNAMPSPYKESFFIDSSKLPDPIVNGDDVSFSCIASRSMYYEVNFSERLNLNLIFNYNSTEYSIIREVIIKNISLDDSGNYTCKAIGMKHNTNSRWLNIDVKQAKAPIITNKMPIESIHVLQAGISQTLNCNFTGTPFPQVNWSKNDEAIDFHDGSKELLNGGRILRINNVTSEDAGAYRCHVWSRLGEDESIFNVEISSGSQIVLISCITAILLFVSALCIFFGIRFYRERKQAQKMMASWLANFEYGDVENLNAALTIDEQADLLPYNRLFEFPVEKLRVSDEILGSGAFGVVLKAVAKGIHSDDDEKESIVAVKIIKKKAGNDVMKAFVMELKIMVNLGRHLNVVNLLGAVTKNIARQKLMIIAEFCQYGNLKNYLLANRSKFISQLDMITKQFRTVETLQDCIEANNFNTSVLVIWAYQISRGMDYLASRRILHGDLAARNVLLCEKNVVKICDFGLARTLYKTANYSNIYTCNHKEETLLPVRWLALESLGDRTFSTFSDVWSFGVVLWELFSLGSGPYPGIEIDENWYLRIKNGYRMAKPEYADDALYAIMTECWEETPESRPLFGEVESKLVAMLPPEIVAYFVALSERDNNWNAEHITAMDYLKQFMKSPESKAIESTNYANLELISNSGSIM